MKIIVGPMWSKISSSSVPLRLLGYIVIGPALLGLIVAPTATIWIPAWNWPGSILIAISFALISLITVFLLIGLVQQIRTAKVIVIEDCCSLLGMIFAFVIGVHIFGINPTKWDEVIPLKGNKSAEQGGYSDAEQAV